MEIIPQIAGAVIVLSLGLWFIRTIVGDAIDERRRGTFDRDAAVFASVFIGFGVFISLLAIYAAIIWGMAA